MRSLIPLLIFSPQRARQGVRAVDAAHQPDLPVPWGRPVTRIQGGVPRRVTENTQTPGCSVAVQVTNTGINLHTHLDPHTRTHVHKDIDTPHNWTTKITCILIQGQKQVFQLILCFEWEIASCNTYRKNKIVEIPPGGSLDMGVCSRSFCCLKLQNVQKCFNSK